MIVVIMNVLLLRKLWMIFMVSLKFIECFVVSSSKILVSRRKFFLLVLVLSLFGLVGFDNCGCRSGMFSDCW